MIVNTSSKVLPNLDVNIKNGNSLVDYSFAKFDLSIFSNLNLMEKIKMFDWISEFGGKKFDAIVGNPPYVRVQNMVKYSPEEYNFYKSRFSGYATADSALLDKYYLFIERALSLLNEEGLLGYVVPHKFMNIQSGSKLREWLSKRQSVKRIFHFGTFQVFENRSTYTCILILSPKPQEKFEISFVEDWNRFLFEHTAEYESYPAEYIGGRPWTFLPARINRQLRKMMCSCVPLKELAEIFVGVQTSADKIYVIHADAEDDKSITFTGKDKVQRTIEKGLLRKSIYDAQLTKYVPIEANSYIIYPYKEVDGKVVLISGEEMECSYPLTYSYLNEFRKELDKRNMPNRTNENWFAYGRSQSIKRFTGGEHLIWPVLSVDSNYVYDNEMVVFTGGGNGPFYGLEMKKESRVSILYIQAILNHWLMELLVKSKASIFQGDYYSHGKQFIAELPIYRIDFQNAEEASLHDKIVDLVKTMMDLSAKQIKGRNSTVKNVICRSISALQQELENVINELYGVKRLESED